MESKNVWQQSMGGNIWGANSFEWKKKLLFFVFLFFFGGGGGGGGGGWEMENNFFLKQIFWRGNFWYQVLEERFL